MSASHMYEFASSDRRFSIEHLFGSYKGAWLAAAVAVLYLVYKSLVSLGFFPLLPVLELCWNALVFATPASLAIALDKRRNPAMYASPHQESKSPSEMHAFKSDALRRVFGLESGALNLIPGANTIRRASWLGGITSTRSDAPPGLGNWDNSCYQNSVLQGLSAVRSLTTYLEHSDTIKQQGEPTTAGSLRDTIVKLNHNENNGRRLWTPAKLKSMSSWQQQDAQEYFSKIMDDMEKETAKAIAANVPSDGLKEVKKWDRANAAAVDSDNKSVSTKPSAPKTPLDGYLAQRVACLRCGFSEGLSMIPFNCLTVPLGASRSYNLSQCLDSYTSLEEISGVECAKCTLLLQKSKLENMTKPKLDEAATAATAPASDKPAPALSLPPELREMMLARLEAIQQALDQSDFSDPTLNKKCQIPKKARVSSTKTKQMVVARAPTGLVVHVNRSMFDENTGDMRKNLAHVNYPKVLDLGPWCLGVESSQDNPKEEWRMDPAKSMIARDGRVVNSENYQYILRAAVCHYGRHENGHYVCYREHPEMQDEGDDGVVKMRWWRLSDDDVSSVTEDQVLAQGGVFMLFYEKLDTPATPERAAVEEGINDKVAATIATDEKEQSAHIRDESKQPEEPVIEAAKAVGTTPATPKIEPGVETVNDAQVEVEQPTSSPVTAAEPPILQPVSEIPPQQMISEVKNKSSTPTMRTARRGSKMNKGGFESAFRPRQVV